MPVNIMLDLKFSRIEFVAMLLFHLVAIAAVNQIAAPVLIVWILRILTGLSLLTHIRRLSGLSAEAITRVRLASSETAGSEGGEKQCLLYYRNRLQPADWEVGYFSEALIVLRFSFEPAHRTLGPGMRRRHLLLLTDSLPEQQARRLRTGVRFHTRGGEANRSQSAQPKPAR
ncbi:MAG: hypothetical protein WDZ76_05690 [Pseudohongiellaceae bacterium]